jgi:hypothetical protein
MRASRQRVFRCVPKVRKLAKRWRCTTDRLISLNQRNRERLLLVCASCECADTCACTRSVNEIVIIQARVLAQLLGVVRSCLPALYAAADGIIMLDMLMAFAWRAVRGKPYGMFVAACARVCVSSSS